MAILGGGRAEAMPGFENLLDDARTGVRKVLVQTTYDIEGDREKLIGLRVANTLYATDAVENGAPLEGARPLIQASTDLTDKMLDLLERNGHKKVTVQREFAVPYRGNLDVRVGQSVQLGDTLTKGPLWPQDVLAWRGLKGVAEYLVQEVQKVYKAQGISIHDKHIEVIVRQMLRKRRVKDAGDTDIMPGKLVDIATFTAVNEDAKARGLTQATADFVLLGITEAALATESFLSAASFQKTTKVLTEAATHGREDYLEGSQGERDHRSLDSCGHGLAAQERDRGGRRPGGGRVCSGQRRPDARRRVAARARRRARRSTWTTCLACPAWAPKTTSWRRRA